MQTVLKTRGPEAFEFFERSFLPSQGWPPEMATEFTVKLRDLDLKSFRKYFAGMSYCFHRTMVVLTSIPDIVRASRV